MDNPRAGRTGLRMSQSPKHATGEREPLLDGQLRDAIPAIVRDAGLAIEPVLNRSWDVSRAEMTQGVLSYITALVESIERQSFDPLEQYLVSLDPLWTDELFAIDPIIKSMFLIEDVVRAHLPGEYRDNGERLVQQYTRSAIEVLSERSVSVVTGQLAKQVELHRAGEARLMSLQRVSAALVSDLDLDRAMTLIAEEARQLITADGVGIRLTTSDTELGFIGGSGDDRQILRSMTLPVEQSLSGIVLRSGKPMRVDDVRQDPRVNVHYVEDSGGRSLLVAPLTVRDTAIGIIGGTSSRVAAFTQEDEELLSLFADHAASAIQNANLYNQAQEHIAELEMLHRVSQVVTSSLELDEIFQTLYDEVARIMPADAFLIALARPDGFHDVEFIIDDGRRYPPKRGIELSPILAEGLDQRELVVQQDVTTHEAYDRAHRFGNVDRQAKSLLAAPLVRGNKTIGMISAQSYEEYDYRDPEARILRTIANQAAVAIEHARLYQQAHHLAIAEERARLAREIHDTLAQGLVSVILCLERLDLTVPRDDSEHRVWIERALELSRNSLDEARRSVRDLRAAPLEGRTLLEAIANLVALVEDDVDFDVHATLPPTLPPLSARVETALFRVVQEAITNARKHSRCTRLSVELEMVERELCLTIDDDGVGFAAETSLAGTGHFGLTTMRERVDQIGGSIHIESDPGDGTRIHVSIPANLAFHNEF
jgi:signal transduction histidine kinase